MEGSVTLTPLEFLAIAVLEASTLAKYGKRILERRFGP